MKKDTITIDDLMDKVDTYIKRYLDLEGPTTG